MFLRIRDRRCTVTVSDGGRRRGGTKPKNATHWSTRSLAEELGLSQSTVSRIWRAFNLQPHRADTSDSGHQVEATWW